MKKIDWDLKLSNFNTYYDRKFCTVEAMLFSLHIKRNKTIKNMSKMLGVNRESIRKKLIEFNIKSQPKPNPRAVNWYEVLNKTNRIYNSNINTVREMLFWLYIDNNKTIKYISEILGVNRESIRKKLIETGIRKG